MGARRRPWLDSGWLRDRALNLGLPIVTAAIAFVGALARQTGVPRYRTVWAEDGQVFGQCPLIDPFPPQCLVTPYDGYLHAVPRVLAWLGASLPPEWFSYSVTGLAALAIAACAFLVARAVAEATTSRVAGVIAGASLALVHPAGAEVAGNLTNLPWVLFTAAATVLVCGILGRSLGRLDVCLVLLTIGSSPFGFLLIGLALLERYVPSRPDRGTPWFLVASVALAAIQLGMALISPRRPIPHEPVSVLSPVGWLFELVYGKGPFGGIGLIPGWIVGVAATALLVGLTFRRYRSRGASMPGGADWRRWWASPLALLALGLAGAAVFWAATFVNRHLAARYDYVPAAVSVIALMLGIALVARAWPKSIPVAGRRVAASTMLVTAVAILVAIGFGTTFRTRTNASRGPSYPTAFREAARACEAGAQFAVVGISPLPAGSVATTWKIEFPCDVIRR